MVRGKDLIPRKKREGRVINPIIRIHGKKRYICKVHGLVSIKDTYINNHSHTKEYAQCRICLRISYKKYNAKRNAKIGNVSTQEKIKIRKKWKLRYYDSGKQKIRDEKNSKELRDPYIKHMIRQRFGMKTKEISPIFIEAYRALLLLKRTLYKRT